MQIDKFYDDLPELQRFDEIFSALNYHDAPKDWIIIVTDVVNSTEAIAAGKYKQVNIAGVVGLAVASNVVGHLRFPFTFGGDGVTLLLPPGLAEPVIAHLRDLKATIQQSFGLELRVGSLSVSDVVVPERPVRVAKLRVSEKYTQAVFDGAGVAYAEELIKGGTGLESGGAGLGDGQSADVQPDAQQPDGAQSESASSATRAAKADTSGFSCRWREIPSGPGEVVALIVDACDTDPELRERAIRQVSEAVRVSLGEEEMYHPVATGLQQQIQTREEIDNEALVHTRGRHGFVLALQRLSISIQIIVVNIAVRLKLPLSNSHKTFSQVHRDNITHADFRKYDGRLKMVLACSPEGRNALVQRLDEMEQAGQILYGIHVANHALITCIMHLRTPDEVHFIDGGDGGYTLAAAQIKAKQCGSVGARGIKTEERAG
ncbi:MAG: DUF3095 domain-containing protein [Spirochaetaceae bacterium]|nr:MAG: DUF3095 domain-containing protein [Spirochaetaceae bacterium]